MVRGAFRIIIGENRSGDEQPPHHPPPPPLPPPLNRTYYLIITNYFANIPHQLMKCQTSVAIIIYFFVSWLIFCFLGPNLNFLVVMATVQLSKNK